MPWLAQTEWNSAPPGADFTLFSLQVTPCCGALKGFSPATVGPTHILTVVGAGIMPPETVCCHRPGLGAGMDAFSAAGAGVAAPSFSAAVLLSAFEQAASMATAEIMAS